MSAAGERPATTAARLRQEFDQSFAAAPATAIEATEDLLGVRIGGDPYVLRLAEIAGLHLDRKIVPVPGPVPELLGITSVRGVLVPVYDLRLLLGCGAVVAARGFVLARAATPVGLVVDGIEGHLCVHRNELLSDHGGGETNGHVRGALRRGGVAIPLLDVASILAAITRRAGPSAPPPAKER